MMNYYTSLIYLKENGPLYTKYQIIDKIRKINSRNIMLLLQEIFQIDIDIIEKLIKQCDDNINLVKEYVKNQIDRRQKNNAISSSKSNEILKAT